MTKNPSRLEVSWEEIVKLVIKTTGKIIEFVRETYNRVVPCNYYDGIITIPRGGLVPARLFAESLNIDKIILSDTLDFIDKNNKYLIIDDISDSGKTLFLLTEELLKMDVKFETATVFMRINSQYEPNFVGEIIFDKKWLEFPWETHMILKLVGESYRIRKVNSE